MHKPRSHVQTFCMQTSLHGWQYMSTSHFALGAGQPRPAASPERRRSQQEAENSANENYAIYISAFWFAIVCLSMVTAGTFLYNNTWDFMHSNVVTTVDTMTAPLSEVYFPSVVVCNINQVRDSYFEELLHGANLDKNSKIDRVSSPWENINQTSLLVDNIEGTHQLCRDMFVYSKWNGSVTFRFESERDFGTDYGICCWYTPQFNLTEIIGQSRREGLAKPDWGSWFTSIKKGSQTGKDNGYTMLLDIEAFDYKFLREGSEGLKVALVHPLDMPIMRQTGFHIAPGTENQIAVTPTLITTSAHAMQRFSPEQRDCYSEDEISLKYLPRNAGYRYEMSNCLFEAAFENILERCHCFPSFHTSAGTRAEHFETCQGTDLACVNELMNQMGQFEHVEYKNRKVKCRSNCEDQVNSVFVTSSAYPNKRVFVKRPEFCYTLTRLLEKCGTFKRIPLSGVFPDLCPQLEAISSVVSRCRNNDWMDLRQGIQNCSDTHCPLEDMVWKYARKNLALLNIFIKEPYAKRFLKDVKTTWMKFIANSGSILVLCMGFSFISGAEILFHCFFGGFGAICSKMRKNPLALTQPERNCYRNYDFERNFSGISGMKRCSTSAKKCCCRAKCQASRGCQRKRPFRFGPERFI